MAARVEEEGAEMPPLECPEVLEEGVYRYEPGRGWVRGLPSLREGPVVLVFVNLLCRPGCVRVMGMVERLLGRLVEEGRVRVGLLVCTRFRYVCFDEEARGLFSRFNIIASPSVVVLYGSGEPLAAVKGSLRVERELPGVLEELRARVEPRAPGARGAPN